MKRNLKGHPFILTFVAVAILFALSLVPWGKYTGGTINDFDLLSSLKHDSVKTKSAAGGEFIDPELTQFMCALDSNKVELTNTGNSADSIGHTQDQANGEPEIIEERPPRLEGQMVIEDYTTDGRGLSRLKHALSTGSARIAVLGDSYIEGDIFSQDIREQMQEDYGGKGVGYVPATSIVSGFRTSVGHKFSGWTQKNYQQTSSSPYFGLMGEYFVGEPGASIAYKGTKKNSRLASWDISRIMFVSPNDGTITMTADADTVKFDIVGSEEVQSIALNSPTSQIKINSDINGLVFLGAYLDAKSGVSVDCMSLRGYSGISHRNLNVELAKQMRRYVDYDLIILEYGINALSSEQSDYSHYGSLMAQVATRVRECYPNADILMLAIGDRGQKIDGTVSSIPTAANMVAAQRKAAQQAGCLFWDTREAMGGEGAVLSWRKEGLINPDYIHLNSKGGKALATELVTSIKKELE